MPGNALVDQNVLTALGGVDVLVYTYAVRTQDPAIERRYVLLLPPDGEAARLHAEALVASASGQPSFLSILLSVLLIQNVFLGVFNLLPLPVLDGGQMVFATIGRIRGRPLPANVIATTQSVFFVLLLSMIAYVTLFSDVPRIMREYRAERAVESKSSPAPTPAPAK